MLNLPEKEDDEKDNKGDENTQSLLRNWKICVVIFLTHSAFLSLFSSQELEHILSLVRVSC